VGPKPGKRLDCGIIHRPAELLLTLGYLAANPDDLAVINKLHVFGERMSPATRTGSTRTRARVRRTTRRPVRSSAPRWSRRKELRPGEILAAALEQFVERGYAATKLEDVARRAGITKGAMYRYYDSKEALFKAMVLEMVVPHVEHFEREVSSSSASARDLLTAFAHGWVERVYSSPVSGLAKLMVAEASNFPDLASFYHEEVIARSARALTRLLERGVQRGEFRPLDMQSAVVILRAPLILMAIWKHSLLRCDPKILDESRYVETYLDMMMNGLLAPPAELHRE